MRLNWGKGWEEATGTIGFFPLPPPPSSTIICCCCCCSRTWKSNPLPTVAVIELRILSGLNLSCKGDLGCGLEVGGEGGVDVSGRSLLTEDLLLARGGDCKLSKAFPFVLASSSSCLNLSLSLGSMSCSGWYRSQKWLSSGCEGE